MKRLLPLLCVLVCCVGCQIPGLDPPSKAEHPFAATERIVERQAVAAESSATSLTALSTETKATNAKLDALVSETSETNGKLDALIDQLKLTAGQQCDLLKEVQEQGARAKEALSRQLSAVSPADAGPQPSAISQEPSPLFPSSLFIVVNGSRVPMGEFVSQWYRGDWPAVGAELEACLLRMGVRPEHLEMLSDEAKRRLHGAMHQQLQPSISPPKASEPKPEVIPLYPPPQPQVKQPDNFVQWQQQLQPQCPNGVCRKRRR